MAPGPHDDVGARPLLTHNSSHHFPTVETSGMTIDLDAREGLADGTAVLMVEQNARQALRLADRAYVLETGSIVLSGSAPELAADPRAQAAYLGGSVEESPAEGHPDSRPALPADVDSRAGPERRL